MKRSEMIRIIWEAINELEDAEHILQRVERLVCDLRASVCWFKKHFVASVNTNTHGNQRGWAAHSTIATMMERTDNMENESF